MQELGPFRVTEDNKTLSRNMNAWNNGKSVTHGFLYSSIFGNVKWLTFAGGEIPVKAPRATRYN